MAEIKTLNTRIKLRIDTLENWNSSSAVLLPGEIAFASVAASEGTGLTEPVIMAKIATEEGKTFSELPWAFHAKASDVLAACKSEAALKAFINGVIADAGIASSSAMEALAGKVTTAEGKITALENELNTAETGLKARMTAAEGDIAALEGLVGEKSVAVQISEAITALDLANTYEVKGEAAKVQTTLNEYKTSNDKAVADNKAAIEAEAAAARAAEKANSDAIAAIKDSTTIDSFKDVEDALAGKEAAGAAAQALADAKTYADGKDTAMNTRVEALEAIDHSHTFVESELNKIADGDVAKWNASEQNAKDYTDAEIEEWVGTETVSAQIGTAITNLDLANTYAAKVHQHVKADITDFAHTHEISEVNGLQGALDGKQAVGDYATKDEAQGYADAKDEAIAAAKKAGDDAAAAASVADGKAVAAQNDVDALETYVGTFTHDTAKSVVEYINAKTDGIATSSNLEALAGRVTAAEGEIDALQSDLNAAETGLKARVAELEGLVGDKAVATQISTAVAAEAEIARAAEKANADAITKLNANAETAGSVDYKIAQAVAGIMENPDDTMNSINELVTWTNDHAQDALEMSNQVTANKNAIATLNGDASTAGSVDKKIADAIAAENLSQYATDGELTAVDNRLKAVESAVGETGSVATAIEGAVTEAKGYTDAEVKKLAEGAVATNASAISALEDLVGDDKVSDQITAVTNPLDERIRDLEAVDHEHANNAELDKFADGDKAKLDSAVQTVTAGTGLTATKTGTDVAIEIDETVTWIFDCGTSAV